MSEFVSVVIPTRNRCARLRKAIDSVIAQRGVEFEIIVVDDASTDDTQKVISALCLEEPRLRYSRNERPLGGAGARNAGAAAARGEFIAFLDDDDQFLPGKLTRQVAALHEHPDAPAASGSFLLYIGDRCKTVRRLHAPRTRIELLRANMLGGASMCMVRKTSFLAIDGFDARLPSCQDWDLWLKLHSLGPIIVCPEPLVRYHMHDGSQITGNPLAEYRGRRRVHLRYAAEMPEKLRRESLASLLYYRRVRFGATAARRTAGLLAVLLLSPPSTHAAYLWRTARFILRGQLTRSDR